MPTVLLLSSMQCQWLLSCLCITPYLLGGSVLPSPASQCCLQLLSLLNAACMHPCELAAVLRSLAHTATFKFRSLAGKRLQAVIADGSSQSTAAAWQANKGAH